MTGRIPFDPEYVAKLGRFIYAVTYLEWSLLGDLSSIPDLPAVLSLQELAGCTTGGIARRVTDNIAAVTDPRASPFLATAANHLREVAVMRNDVLHARPATVDGKQRLYRWLPGRSFAVSDAWLDEQIADVERREAEVSGLRVI